MSDINPMPTPRENVNLAATKNDRDRMLCLIAQHQLATGQKITIKQLVTMLLDKYEAAG